MASSALEAVSTSAIVLEAPLGSRFGVHISAEFASAKRCLFYALTLPEYLEAWLCMPDAFTVCATPVDHDILRLDLQDSSILLRFDARSADSIRLNWCEVVGESRCCSVVSIDLSGKDGLCAIELKHDGFRTQEERDCHLAMWTRSFAKLQHLMRR